MPNSQNSQFNIRPAQPKDLEDVMQLSDATGLFQPPELEEVRGMLTAWMDGELGEEHQWIVCESDTVVGVAYFAPEQMSPTSWNLHMIAIHPDCQGQGIGGRLIRHVEEQLRARNVYQLLVETSGMDSFEQTREFYRKHAYVQEACIPDYYRVGDDKIVFRKKLQV